jgi:hypothetical protein
MIDVDDRFEVEESTPVVAQPDPASRHPWSGALVAAPPTALVALHATRYGHWLVDDAGITFAYVRSLTSGAGPVLQPGAAPVEGFSNPAWAAILAVGRALHLFDHGTWSGVPDLVLFPKLVALICCCAMFWCFHAIVAAVRTRQTAAVTIAAGFATAAVPSFVIWSMSGLENSLFALAVVALATVLVRAAQDHRLMAVQAAVSCGLLAALAALTRPDGIIYLVAYPVALLVLHRGDTRRTVRAAGLSIGAAFVPLAGYLAWRVANFDSLLPNTALAKQQGLPVPTNLNKVTDLVSYVGGLPAIVAVAVVTLALRRAPGLRAPLIALFVPLGLAVLSYCVLERDWMAELRFTTPIWPLASLVVVLSAADLLEVAHLRVRATAGAVMVVVSVLTLQVWNERSEAFAQRPTASLCGVARNTGYIFNTYADRLGIASGTLLAVDAGGTSLTSRLRFVDLAGLADRRIARYWADGDMAGLRDHVFDEVEPTFIRIWFGWDGVGPTGILDDHRLERDYVLIWGPPQGGGNWVRRDAVTEPEALAELQAAAPGLAEVVDAPFARGVTDWWCPPLLRPSAPGEDPVPRLPS